MKKSLLWDRTGLENTRSVQSYRLPARKERCDGKDYAGRCRIKGRGSPKQLGLGEIIFAKKTILIFVKKTKEGYLHIFMNFFFLRIIFAQIRKWIISS